MPRWKWICPKERFLMKVNIKSKKECWEWMASKNVKGYGQFYFRIANKWKHGLAHRFSWRLYKGKIPDGLLICHRCDNPSCVNPDHLFIGTNLDNMLDRNRKNRQAKLKGEKNGGSKLTEKEVRKIRTLLESKKYSYPELAKMFEVSRSTISAIANKQNWAWI